jgi:hypothetical protein
MWDQVAGGSKRWENVQNLILPQRAAIVNFYRSTGISSYLISSWLIAWPSLRMQRYPKVLGLML